MDPLNAVVWGTVGRKRLAQQPRVIDFTPKKNHYWVFSGILITVSITNCLRIIKLSHLISIAIKLVVSEQLRSKNMMESLDIMTMPVLTQLDWAKISLRRLFWKKNCFIFQILRTLVLVIITCFEDYWIIWTLLGWHQEKRWNTIWSHILKKTKEFYKYDILEN